MTVVATIPSRQYQAGSFNNNFSVPANTTRVRATLTRESWPAGPIGGIRVNYPDGTLAVGATFNGGVNLDLKGNPQTVCGIEVAAKGGFLPTGSYSVAIDVLQTLNTSITVERF